MLTSTEVTVDGIVYTVDAAGVATPKAQTNEGWVDTEGGRMFYRNGVAVVDEFIEYEGEVYYLDENGYMHTGWLVKNGSDYYFDSTGVMKKGLCEVDNVLRIFALEDGHMIRDGEITIAGETYIVDAGGVATPKAQTNEGWVDTEGGRMFYRDGVAVVDEFIEYEGRVYYLDENGYMFTSGWKEQKDESGNTIGWRFFNSEGKAKRSDTFEVQTAGGKQHAFDADGFMLYGWVSSALNQMLTDQEGWKEADYYFGEQSDGSLKTGWQTINVYGGWKDEAGYADHSFYFCSDESSIGQKSTGWKTIEEYTYYLDGTGAMLEGLHEVEGVLRYFAPADGYMLTNTEVTVDGIVYTVDAAGVATPKAQTNEGWVDTEGGRMFYRNGAAVVDEFIEYEGEVYYLDENGYMHTGWLVKNGSDYYFDSTGVMKKGLCEVDNVLRIFALEDGHMIRDGEITIAGETYIVDADGVATLKAQTNEGWVDTEGGRMFYRDGAAVIDEFIEYEGRVYYLDENGYMFTSGWKEQKDESGNTIGWRRFDSKGRAKRSDTFELQSVGDNQYAFNADGFMLYGWVSSALNQTLTDQEGWKEADYYFGEQGDGRLKTGWQTINVYGGWKDEAGYADHSFYFCSDESSIGQKSTGWKTIEEYTYYLDGTGAMLEGLHEVEGALYYFDPTDGHMLTGTEVTVNGVKYVIDDNGVAIQESDVENPVIITQPESATGIIGDTVNFYVEANGIDSYQWQFSRDNGETWQSAGFTGSRTATMTVELNATRIQYSFRCELTGKDGSKLYTNVVKVIENFEITKQPSDVEAYLNDTVEFRVEANGASSYQWQFSRDNGETWQSAGFSGNRTAMMTVELNATRIQYSFRCELTGKDGSKLYTDVVRAVEAFEITKQPSSVEANVNDTVEFRVEAVGVSSYQWQFSRDNEESWQLAGFSGNRTEAMTVELNATRIQYSFRCELTGKDGSKLYTDSVKAVEIFEITKQPSNTETYVNGTVEFNVEAVGVNSYQWQFSRDNGETWQSAGFSGNRTATMTVELNATRIQYNFRCELTGRDGSKLYTDIVKAEEIFEITKQPSSIEAYVDDTVEFNVEAVGVSYYQWQFSRDNGETWQTAGFSGNRTATMSVDLNAVRIRYIFRCELTGKNGSKLYTDTVKAEKIELFEITKQPSSVNADVNDTVIFSVEAIGANSYQWQFSRNNGETWQAAGFDGSRTAAMTVELNTTRIKYSFRCELTNADGETLYTDVVTIQ